MVTCTSAGTLRSATSGTVWAPSAGFKINDARQDRIAIKETSLVEYRFASDSFEVRHVRAAGQVDIDIEEVLAQMGGEH